MANEADSVGLEYEFCCKHCWYCLPMETPPCVAHKFQQVEHMKFCILRKFAWSYPRLGLRAKPRKFLKLPEAHIDHHIWWLNTTVYIYIYIYTVHIIYTLCFSIYIQYIYTHTIIIKYIIIHIYIYIHCHIIALYQSCKCIIVPFFNS